MQWPRSQLSHVCKYKRGKILKFKFHLCRQLWNCIEQLHICNELKEGKAIFCRFLHHTSERGLSEPAFGNIDDTQETQCVARIVDHAQIRNDILDLTAVIEPYGAYHSIWNTCCIKGFLNVAGLRICAVENSDIAILCIEHGMQTLNLTHDERRFVLLRTAFIDCDWIARGIIRPEIFFLACQIVFDNGICRRKDILR